MSEVIHMSRFEKTLSGGAEWPLKVPAWVVLQLSRGIAYIGRGQLNGELPLGGVVVVPPGSPVTVRASVLDSAAIRNFGIRVSSLSGLLTSEERLCLETEVAQECTPYRQLPSSHPIAVRMDELFRDENPLSLHRRLGFMHTLAEWLSPLLAKAAQKRHEQEDRGPRTRLRQFLNQRPESELIGLTLSDVAKQICCCDRHASRLFHKVCGCGFRKYISDLRLNKACHLLLQGKQKIIDVALESGHSSLALFNYSFKNRFRMTPSEWRERHQPRETRSSRPVVSATLVAA